MIVVEADPLLGSQGHSGNFYNINSGGADIRGFELEVLAFLTDRLRIRFAGDVNDTEVNALPNPRNFEDSNELIYAPGHNATIAVDYDIPLARDWMLTLHADHSIMAEQYNDTANTVTIPSWDRSNARATVRSVDGKWRVALYATNLANEEIIRNIENVATYYWHPPRQIGIEVGYRM